MMRWCVTIGVVVALVAMMVLHSVAVDNIVADSRCSGIVANWNDRIQNKRPTKQDYQRYVALLNMNNCEVNEDVSLLAFN